MMPVFFYGGQISKALESPSLNAAQQVALTEIRSLMVWLLIQVGLTSAARAAGVAATPRGGMEATCAPCLRTQAGVRALLQRWVPIAGFMPSQHRRSSWPPVLAPFLVSALPRSLTSCARTRRSTSSSFSRCSAPSRSSTAPVSPCPAMPLWQHAACLSLPVTPSLCGCAPLRPPRDVQTAGPPPGPVPLAARTSGVGAILALLKQLQSLTSKASDEAMLSNRYSGWVSEIMPRGSTISAPVQRPLHLCRSQHWALLTSATVASLWPAGLMPLWECAAAFSSCWAC